MTMQKMTFRVTAVIYCFMGAAFIVFPALVLFLMQFELTPGGGMVARSYGGLLVAVGIANWPAGNSRPAEIRLLLWANLIWHPLSAVAIGAATGAVNFVGWIFTFLHVLMGIGFWMTWTRIRSERGERESA